MSAPIESQVPVEASDSKPIIQTSNLTEIGEKDELIIKHAPGAKAELAAEKWEDLNLNPQLLKSIYVNCNFESPSQIQALILPQLVGKQCNCICQGRNGVGKTAAFLLAMLSNIDWNEKGVQAMIMVPTRELAVQTEARLKQLITDPEGNLLVHYILALGGMMFEGVSNITAPIVIGTPGMLKMLVGGGTTGRGRGRRAKPALINLSKLKVFVLDEADEMVENFKEETEVVKKTALKSGATPQFLLFSATFLERCLAYSRTFTDRNALEVLLKTEELNLETINQYFILMTSEKSFEEKMKHLGNIFSSTTKLGQVIIFVNTVDTANRLARELESGGWGVMLFTGKQTREKRDALMDDFRKKRCNILVSTNVLARGVDVLGLNLVVNFDLPMQYRADRSAPEAPDYESYLHRIGRTGRFGRRGVAVTFITNSEINHLLSIQTMYKSSINQMETEDSEAVARAFEIKDEGCGV